MCLVRLVFRACKGACLAPSQQEISVYCVSLLFCLRCKPRRRLFMCAGTAVLRIWSITTTGTASPTFSPGRSGLWVSISFPRIWRFKGSTDGGGADSVECVSHPPTPLSLPLPAATLRRWKDRRACLLCKGGGAWPRPIRRPFRIILWSSAFCAQRCTANLPGLLDVPVSPSCPPLLFFFCFGARRLLLLPPTLAHTASPRGHAPHALASPHACTNQPWSRSFLPRGIVCCHARAR